MKIGCGGLVAVLLIIGIVGATTCKHGFSKDKMVNIPITKTIKVKDSVKTIKSDTSVLVQCYGLFDENKLKNENVEYEMSAGNLILSIIFFETIIVPIQYVGYYLYEPVGLKNTKPINELKGTK